MRTAIFICGAMAGLVGASNIGMDLDREFGLFLRAAASGQNLQTFTGQLGGELPEAITNTGNSDRPFQIAGGETFTKLSDAVGKSCSNQFDVCQKAANAPGGGGGGGGDNKNPGALTVQACTDQQTACKSNVNNNAVSSAGAASSTTAQSTTSTATTSSLGILRSQDALNFYFCDS